MKKIFFKMCILFIVTLMYAIFFIPYQLKAKEDFTTEEYYLRKYFYYNDFRLDRLESIKIFKLANDKILIEVKKNHIGNIEEFNKDFLLLSVEVLLEVSKLLNVNFKNISIMYIYLDKYYSFSYKNKNFRASLVYVRDNHGISAHSRVRIQYFRNLRTNETEINSNKLANIRHFTKDFIESYYSNKKSIVADELNFLQFNIRELKNEVIKKSNLWEKLEITIFFSAEENGDIKIYMIIDGQFAAGLLYPNNLENYYDMEPKYFSELKNYTDDLLIKLKNYLEQKI